VEGWKAGVGARLLAYIICIFICLYVYIRSNMYLYMSICVHTFLKIYMCIYVVEDDSATHPSGPRDASARTAAAAVLGPAYAALLGLHASAAVVPAESFPAWTCKSRSTSAAAVCMVIFRHLLLYKQLKPMSLPLQCTDTDSALQP
jgi:hypothetical protein